MDQLARRHGRLDGVEEADELLMPMPGHAAADHGAVEGFFAKLTNRRLRRGVFRSLVDLQAAINQLPPRAQQTSCAFRLDRQARRHHRCSQPRVPSVRFDPLASRVFHTVVNVVFMGSSGGRGLPIADPGEIAAAAECSLPDKPHSVAADCPAPFA